MSYSPVRCHIRLIVKGILDESWEDYFGPLTIEPHGLNSAQPTTILMGDLPDQSAFVGILNSLQGLNLTLLAVDYMCEAA